MATKFSSAEFQMVLESFDYIRNHPDMTTEGLPDIWVKFWSIPDFFNGMGGRTDNVQLLVFMFILRMNHYPEDKLDDFVKSFHFNWLFCCFQIILATINYCRDNHIPISPFPLFDLQKYSWADLQEGERLLMYYDILTKHSTNEH